MIKYGALILAGGSGSRMNSQVHKQFLPVNGKPMFLLSTEAFLAAGCETVVVTAEEDREQVVSELRKAGFTVPENDTVLENVEAEFPGNPDRSPSLSEGGKGFVRVSTGGAERWQSSLNGLRYLKKLGGCTYVLIHDAARPFVSAEIIERAKKNEEKYGASAAAVPVKDTVKIADKEGFVRETPDRKNVYLIQTPQAFSFELILGAYEKLAALEHPEAFGITDDAGCAEQFTEVPVRLFEGAYGNVKITTPDDLRYVDSF